MNGIFIALIVGSVLTGAFAGNMQAIVFLRLGVSGYVAVLPLVCGWIIAGTMLLRAIASYPDTGSRSDADS